jgi:hypothetical protein
VTRPLPWHDTPTCGRRSDNGLAVCGGPILISIELAGSVCGACGASFVPNVAERAQLLEAETAWNRVLRGEVHEDKACARCGGCLEVERFRLCAACVEAENAERQGVLFPP